MFYVDILNINALELLIPKNNKMKYNKEEFKQNTFFWKKCFSFKNTGEKNIV